MAGKKQLPPVRPVGPDESAPPQSYSDAAERGERVDELKAMRRVLAAHIDSENTLARDLAPLMRQAREISEEIEELESKYHELAFDSSETKSIEDADWKPHAI